SLKNSWDVHDFENANYHFAVHGPNGCFREFIGSNNDPLITISCAYQHDAANAKKLTGNIEINLHNAGNTNAIEITDHYTKAVQTKLLNDSATTVVLDLSKTYGWYDFTVKVKGNNTFEKRYAGR